ncbi:NADPH dehydrogenase NamA [Halobacillus sp. ACCC02827]|uniref:NADPH dehydrogenase NamA n=1 Tax=Bacillaceae TaxID=186817 RepID=UPI00041FCEBD|nr:MULTISPECIES: NADPH dehydrogenase NamA [Bacillaceae]QHT47082.1 NADPH dehydrogenase NamA [Bacillus sp. SB49]WJE14310.1 NADPH dehydrogenase NamA [Halobacillus sp. ACCC02827]
MKHKLFHPYTVKDVTLKNRIVMSPMCMYSAHDQDGKVQPFHLAHYESRSAGQVGLVIIEATSVLPEGRISHEDLGIWEDEQIEGLKQINEGIHRHGAKAGIQLAHAGRKANLRDEIFAPTQEAFSSSMKVPTEMSKADIDRTIDAFREAASRSKRAGFDIIELHAAHGYLINQFLSPLTNKRTDEYGGSRANRYRFLKEIIKGVKEVWDGPLFTRISGEEYREGGNQMEDFIYFSEEMKKQGVDLIDVSSGGVVPASIEPYPGYQVKFAEQVKEGASIDTGAVGLITTGNQAEEILQNDRADLIFLARPLLRNPYWAKQAADELGYPLEGPIQYTRAW